MLSWNSKRLAGRRRRLPERADGRLLVLLLIAAATSVAVSPRLVSLAGSSQIRIAYSLRPKFRTGATPGMRESGSTTWISA